ncbi:MAG: glycerol-3-phosphate dehydrogenase [Geminicoccaceae bacterium]
MARIVIIGAGVMGSAIAQPPADNGHRVLLVGSALDGTIIERLRERESHPKLDTPLEGNVLPLAHDQLTKDHLDGADAVVIGVSSAGIPWILDFLAGFDARIDRLMMVTKGLDVPGPGRVRTLPPRIQDRLGPDLPIVGIGGPCIARELANRAQTAVVYGSNDLGAAIHCAELFSTDYYHVRVAKDLTGIEANAALKNFMAIGVAAAWSRFPDPSKGNRRQMNPTAALFEQAVFELSHLTTWLGGEPETAHRLAGTGDLFVTVNAGRNSRLGLRLGESERVSEALAGALKGETVEGVDTGRAIGPALRQAWADDPTLARRLPLTAALLDSILDDKAFAYDMNAYWRWED